MRLADDYDGQLAEKVGRNFKRHLLTLSLIFPAFRLSACQKFPNIMTTGTFRGRPTRRYLPKPSNLLDGRASERAG